MKHTIALGLVTILTVAVFGCKGEEGTGPSGTGLPVDLMNFTNTSAEMGVPGSLVTNPGNISNGNPVRVTVVNPGVGGNIAFEARQGSQVYSVTCTVTDITNVSVAPQVVLQPAASSFDCSDW